MVRRRARGSSEGGHEDLRQGESEKNERFQKKIDIKR